MADEWLRGIENATAELLQMPRSLSFAPEDEDVGFEVRQGRYKAHRILFTPGEETVVVLRIYHGARQRLKASDLER